jgi:hypothetical protein
MDAGGLVAVGSLWLLGRWGLLLPMWWGLLLPMCWDCLLDLMSSGDHAAGLQWEGVEQQMVKVLSVEENSFLQWKNGRWQLVSGFFFFFSPQFCDVASSFMSVIIKI